MLSPSSLVISQGWGLIDLPLRATFSPSHPLARRDVPVALARALCFPLRTLKPFRSRELPDCPSLRASTEHPPPYLLFPPSLPYRWMVRPASRITRRIGSRTCRADAVAVSDAEDCSKFHSSVARNGTSSAGEQMEGLRAVDTERLSSEGRTIRHFPIFATSAK
jgi:hypothetical protein